MFQRTLYIFAVVRVQEQALEATFLQKYSLNRLNRS